MRTCVFYCLHDVEVYETWEAANVRLVAMAELRRAA